MVDVSVCVAVISTKKTADANYAVESDGLVAPKERCIRGRGVFWGVQQYNAYFVRKPLYMSEKLTLSELLW